jgi:hypothetical protein
MPPPCHLAAIAAADLTVEVAPEVAGTLRRGAGAVRGAAAEAQRLLLETSPLQ